MAMTRRAFLSASGAVLVGIGLGARPRTALARVATIRPVGHGRTLLEVAEVVPGLPSTDHEIVLGRLGRLSAALPPDIAEVLDRSFATVAAGDHGTTLAEMGPAGRWDYLRRLERHEDPVVRTQLGHVLDVVAATFLGTDRTGPRPVLSAA